MIFKEISANDDHLRCDDVLVAIVNKNRTLKHFLTTFGKKNNTFITCNDVCVLKMHGSWMNSLRWAKLHLFSFLKFLSKRRSSYGIYLRAVNQSWSPTDILRWYLKMVQNYKVKFWSYTCSSNDWQPLDGGRSYKASSASSSQDGREPPLCSTPGACITPA